MSKLVEALISHIERIQKENKISRVELARKLSVDEKQLWRLKKNKTISLAHLELYAKVLDLDIEVKPKVPHA